jgi:hypothetical protein
MQSILSTLLVLLFLSIFAIPTLACQCMYRGTKIPEWGVSIECCKQMRGEWVNNRDCRAGSISDRLSGFAQCCAGYAAASDCHCPRGCSKEEVCMDFGLRVGKVSETMTNTSCRLRLRRLGRAQLVVFRP